ncbi:MAG: hypothetical protein JW893_07510 [Candidatus Omnitrophica bacterium]|nr:hypothetical protein [Candidatus Omnitrophota bacterium]
MGQIRTLICLQPFLFYNSQVLLLMQDQAVENNAVIPIGDRRILSFAVGLLLLGWGIILNPWNISAWFSDDGVITSFKTYVLIYIVEMVMLALGWLTMRQPFPSRFSAVINIRIIYFVALTFVPFFLGGAYVTTFIDPTFRLQGITASIALSLVWVVFFFGYVLFRLESKKFIFGIALTISLIVTLLYGAEFIARIFVPGWPARGLHGVMPEMGARSWGRVVLLDGSSIGFNSWGQRDRERKRNPTPGITRIAFLGDSYLEESTVVPLSLQTEKKLGEGVYEILNLGVSVSSPDEYFYRLKNIALRLGIARCFLFFYEGNDFLWRNTETLKSFLGILAVYPRDSFFNMIGLEALNYLLMNWQRPVIRAWQAAGDLNAKEQSRWKKIQETFDARMPEVLADIFTLGGEDKVKLIEELKKRDLTSFYYMLRYPDQGLFRSYYLESALESLIQKEEDERIDISWTYPWIHKAYELCQANGIDFTLVIVPRASQVDSRMRRQWLPLTDLAVLFEPSRRAGHKLTLKAREEGIPVIELAEFIRGLPGTYLNLDGHWSQFGSGVISEILADSIAASAKKI